MVDAGDHFLLDATTGFGAEEESAVDRLRQRAFARFVRAAYEIARRIEGNGKFLMDPIILKSDGKKSHRGRRLGEAGGVEFAKGKPGDGRILVIAVDLGDESARHRGDERIVRTPGECDDFFLGGGDGHPVIQLQTQ